MKKHFKEIAERMDACYLSLVGSLKEAGALDDDEANLVADFYIKERLVKRDLVNQRYTVKHGAFWDRAVVRRAVKLAKQKEAA